jgi:hypothetical protein
MSVVSGIVGAKASKSAARAQSDASVRAAEIQSAASDRAIAAQMDMFETGNELTKPWREAGEKALGTLQEKISAGPGEFTEDPGYQFRLSEGQKAIDRDASRQGNVLSGSTTKAATQFGQDYATQSYDNFLNNYYKSLTPLQSVAGVGQTSAGQAAGAAVSTGAGIAGTERATGNAIAGYTINAGEAQAAGDINTANVISGASSSAMDNYLAWKYLSKSG